jgi:hypothetical protein
MTWSFPLRKGIHFSFTGMEGCLKNNMSKFIPRELPTTSNVHDAIFKPKTTLSSTPYELGLACFKTANTIYC